MDNQEIAEHEELNQRMKEVCENLLNSSNGKAEETTAKNEFVKPAYQLIRVQLRDANFSYANWIGADLRYSDLQRIDLQSALLNDVKFTGADLRRADFCRANLSNADLSYTICRDAAFEEAILPQADLSFAYLREASFYEANLEQAKLMEAELIDASFYQANLQGANLTNAQLQKVDFTRANLQGAILEGANLAAANFEGADLSNTNLRNANLSQCELKGANLTGANLEGTIISDSGQNHCRVFLGNHTLHSWKGMRFRSSVELEIAQVLEAKGLLYYPNGLARLGSYQKSFETDFLVCCSTPYGFRWAILEVDGYWHLPEKRAKEHERERMFEHLGVRLYRFDAQLCDNNPEAVVNEFIELICK